MKKAPKKMPKKMPKKPMTDEEMMMKAAKMGMKKK